MMKKHIFCKKFQLFYGNFTAKYYFEALLGIDLFQI
jgi:hypothetical protein